MHIDRKAAEAALRRGHAVLHEGKEVKALPPGAERFEATRHEDGSFTRAGMEAIVRRGESVMIGRQVISRVEDLPAAEELAGQDLSKHEAVIDGIDDQIAALQQQRQRAARAAEHARRAQESQGEQPSAAGPPGGGQGAAPTSHPPPHPPLPEGVPAHPSPQKGAAAVEPALTPAPPHPPKRGGRGESRESER